MSEPTIEELHKMFTEAHDGEPDFRKRYEAGYRALWEAGQRAALSSPAVARLRRCAECGMCSAERCEARSEGDRK